MLVPIANEPRDYAWGSATAMGELLGLPADGRPQAELWLGAHHGSPARILDPSLTGGAGTLEEWIARDPDAALGPGRDRLPFLLKVLAVGAPLSLQAHPDTERAASGFAREDQAGIPLDAPHRNYKDPHPKPEVVVALSETFEALSGFRPVEESRAVFEELGLDEVVRRLDSLEETVGWLVRRADGTAEVLRVVVEAAQGREDASWPTIRRLARLHPDDPGVVVALLLNLVTLRRGEALFQDAGSIHAYLDGVGIEVMIASDNVLRGGLTAKHVDADELLAVLDLGAGPVARLDPAPGEGSIERFDPGVGDFALSRVFGSARLGLSGPAIALCTAGSIRLGGARSTALLSRGEAVYVTPDEQELSFAGDGELFVATTP